MTPLLVFDTGGHDAAIYATFGELARAAGFELEVVELAELIDRPLDQLEQAVRRASVVFFAITSELLARAHDSPIAEKLLDLIERLPHERNRRTFVMFPLRSSWDPACALFLDALGVAAPDEGAITRYLQQPFGAPIPYETTLFPGTRGAELPPGDLFGVTFEDRATGHRVIAGNEAVLTFSSISEHFRYCPQHSTELDRLHARLARELGSGRAGEVRSTVHRTDRARGPLTAWMELLAYEDDADLQGQTRLIDWILRARLDALWISISPNQYYSPIARLKDRTERMHRSISRFTKMLREESSRRAIPLPRVLVSIHLVNNYFKPQPQPQRYARDIYGNEYPDIPDPLDDQFWEQEVIAPIRELALTWPRLSDGVPLAGIVVDLEMYLRHLTGVSDFLGTMSAELEGGARSSFQALEAKAEAIGNRARENYRAAIPGCILGCYAATISLDWFYRGFYRGLSRPDDPLELFTFCGRSHPHQEILAERGIFVRHSTVLMLSKIESRADFSRVDQLLSENPGLWLNRLSRTGPWDPTRWHKLEQMPLDQSERLRFMDYLGAPR